MTDKTRKIIAKPRAREQRDRAHARVEKLNARIEGDADSGAAPGEGTQRGEGLEKLEPVSAGTGAGATFSGSRVRDRGVKRALGAAGEAARAQGKTETVRGAVEDAEAAPAAPLTGTVIGGHTWTQAPAEGDPGTGFYRFRIADVPGIDTRFTSNPRSVVEVFGKDLAQAQLALGHLVSKHQRKGGVQPVDARPTHYRATRLSKKQRLAASE